MYASSVHKDSHTARAVTQTDVTRSSYQPSYVAPDQLENRDSRCRPQHGKKIGTKHNLQVFIPGKNSSSSGDRHCPTVRRRQEIRGGFL